MSHSRVYRAFLGRTLIKMRTGTWISWIRYLPPILETAKQARLFVSFQSSTSIQRMTWGHDLRLSGPETKRMPSRSC